MLQRKCEKCGATIEVSPVKCLAGLIAGSLLGWLIGLPEDIASQMMLENPMIAALLLGRTSAAMLLGYIGYSSAISREKCQVCGKPAKVASGVDK